jgi:hypothetical protein
MSWGWKQGTRNKIDIKIHLPMAIARRFFSPPLMPLDLESPTIVSAHLERPIVDIILSTTACVSSMLLLLLLLLFFPLPVLSSAAKFRVSLTVI